MLLVEIVECRLIPQVQMDRVEAGAAQRGQIGIGHRPNFQACCRILAEPVVEHTEIRMASRRVIDGFPFLRAAGGVRRRGDEQHNYDREPHGNPDTLLFQRLRARQINYTSTRHRTKSCDDWMEKERLNGVFPKGGPPRSADARLSRRNAADRHLCTRAS